LTSVPVIPREVADVNNGNGIVETNLLTYTRTSSKKRTESSHKKCKEDLIREKSRTF